MTGPSGATGPTGPTGPAGSGGSTGASGGALGGAAVYRTTATANIANVTLTALLFDNEEFDDTSYHDNASQTSRLTVPATGEYIVTLTVGWDASSTGGRGIFIIKNGTDSATNRIAGEYRAGLTGSDEQTISAIARLSSGDFVEGYAFQTSSANRTIDPASGIRPRFAIYRLS